MKKHVIFLSLSLLILPEMITAAVTPLFENHASGDSIAETSQNVRIMFYNTENLYDPYDDSTTLDNEFTSSGDKHWNYGRFKRKLSHLYKTIMAAGQWDPPAIVGLAEIENRYVLNKLVYETPLKKLNYRFIQYESPDLRGVDAALLYRPQDFKIISTKNIRIVFPWDTTIRTRDILYVKGILFGSDTLHLLVNHWPSRRGGYTESQPRRNYVAGVLKETTDSLFRKDPSSRILIMGDFNDEPECESLKEVLGAKATAENYQAELVNLMYRFCGSGKGTHKFQGHWGILDQFIVSGNLLDSTMNLYTTEEDVHILQAGFLAEEDERFFGTRPVRTYSGPAYVGGFSDHLPVYLDLFKAGR